MTDVFVSYKAEDRSRIRPLVEALEADGFSVWWDAHLGAGEHWRETIANELDAAKCVIVAWSTGSVGPNGRFVRDEAARALRRGVYVPIKLDAVDPPLGFGETQALPIISWKGNRAAPSYRALVSAVRCVMYGETPSGRGADIERVPTRRAVILSGTVGAIALASAAGWVWLPRSRLRPEVEKLVQDARSGVDHGGVEENANAIGKLRRATDLDPESGLVWGLLALAYVQQSRMAPANEREGFIARGLAAAQRAQAFEPDQPEALAAKLHAMPLFRNWLAVDRACRAALRKHPRNPYVLMRQTALLSQVGRHDECLSGLDQILDTVSAPRLHVGRITLLWNLGRLDEAETALEQAFNLWPRDYMVWFTRFYYLLYNGRAIEALAFIKDLDGRPIGIPGWNFDLVLAQAEALVSASASKINAALQALKAAARRAAGFAENAAIFAAFVASLDAAFEILTALYTNRGFAIADAWFSTEQAVYVGPERNTFILFQRPMLSLRRDARFRKLTREIGLQEYWIKTGTTERVLS